MLAGRVRSGHTGEIILPDVARTENWLERMRGLLGWPPLTEGHGLLITPCNSVHTFFMPVPIDVIFLDRSGTIARITTTMLPYRLAMSVKAAAVIELMAGQAARSLLAPGHRLLWEQSP